MTVETIQEQPLRVVDVMVRFQVSRRTVHRWFRTGLRHYHLGQTPYTTYSALMQFAKPSDGSAGMTAVA